MASANIYYLEETLQEMLFISYRDISRDTYDRTRAEHLKDGEKKPG